MNTIDVVVDPYGGGFFVATCLAVALAGLWIWKVSSGEYHAIMVACVCAFWMVIVVAVIYAYNLPRTLSPGYDYAGLSDIMLLASIAMGIAMFTGVLATLWILTTDKFSIDPWQHPKTILSLATVMALQWLLQTYLERMQAYKVLSRTGDIGAIEPWSHVSAWSDFLVALLFCTATFVSFIVAGLRLPDVRAQWSRRTDWVLESLAYSGWSSMPWGAPYLARYPLNRPGDADDRKDVDETDDPQNSSRDD